MHKSTVAPVVTFSLSVVLAILSLILMPSTVSLHLGLSEANWLAMPKLLPILFLLAVGAGCAAVYHCSKKDVRHLTKYLAFSFAGVFLQLAMLLSNLPG